MIHRLSPPILLTAAAVTLLCVAMVTLRHAAPEITAAVILVLAMLAGTGVGASVTSPTPRRPPPLRSPPQPHRGGEGGGGVEAQGDVDGGGPPAFQYGRRATGQIHPGPRSDHRAERLGQPPDRLRVSGLAHVPPLRRSLRPAPELRCSGSGRPR